MITLPCCSMNMQCSSDAIFPADYQSRQRGQSNCRSLRPQPQRGAESPFGKWKPEIQQRERNHGCDGLSTRAAEAAASSARATMSTTICYRRITHSISTNIFAEFFNQSFVPETVSLIFHPLRTAGLRLKAFSVALAREPMLIYSKHWIQLL